MLIDLQHPVLRVGVTGARELNPSQDPVLEEKLRERVGEVLDAIERGFSNQVLEFSKTPRFQPPSRVASLQLLSPLAEGADRLVAELALERGFSLVCPLPFAKAAYENDFQGHPGSVETFEQLLSRATRVLELDGVHGNPNGEAERAYEAVGRLIVRNTDLIIGIWDGKRGKGLGGTADTIQYAARQGPPVIWIHATYPVGQPVWIRDADDLLPGMTPSEWSVPLQDYLHQLLCLPKRHARVHHNPPHDLGVLLGDWLKRAICRFRGRTRPSPIEEFLDEPSHPAWGIWHVHGLMMRLFARGRAAPWSRPQSPETELAGLWYERFLHADQRAGECAKRYRSSYVLAFLLAAITLTVPAVLKWFGPAADKFQDYLELGSLVALLVLIALDGMFGWQRRAIEYRLLAELCRKQQALAPLAWALPRADTWVGTQAHQAETRLAGSASKKAHAVNSGAHESPNWVASLFGAWLRATPLPTGRIDPAWVNAAGDAAMRDLVDDQIAYHTARREQSHLAGKWLGRLSFGLFVVLLAAALVKVGPPVIFGVANPPWLDGVLGSLSAILPAWSAAFFGIRAFGEFETLAEQSETMLTTMESARNHIEALMKDTAAPLASQSLGSAVAAVATKMMEDLHGWERLFRGKIVDT